MFIVTNDPQRILDDDTLNSIYSMRIPKYPLIHDSP